MAWVYGWWGSLLTAGSNDGGQPGSYHPGGPSLPPRPGSGKGRGITKPPLRKHRRRR